MVLIFLLGHLLCHRDLPAENERNLPRGFRDRAPLTTAWQPNQRDTEVALMTSSVTSSRVRDVARDATDVQQIGIEVLSMPNFEFLKSDHYWQRYGHFCEIVY